MRPRLVPDNVRGAPKRPCSVPVVEHREGAVVVGYNNAAWCQVRVHSTSRWGHPTSLQGSIGHNINMVAIGPRLKRENIDLKIDRKEGGI